MSISIYCCWTQFLCLLFFIWVFLNNCCWTQFLCFNFNDEYFWNVFYCCWTQFLCLLKYYEYFSFVFYCCWTQFLCLKYSYYENNKQRNCCWTQFQNSYSLLWVFLKLSFIVVKHNFFEILIIMNNNKEIVFNTIKDFVCYSHIKNNNWNCVFYNKRQTELLCLL